MKILFLVVNATDRPEIDEDFIWDQFRSGLQSLPAETVVIRRLVAPTQAALSAILRSEPCDVLHLLTEVQLRQNSYSTISLLSTEKRSRALPSRQFAELVTAGKAVKLVVLQTRSTTASESSPVPAELVELGIPAALLAPGFHGNSATQFLRTLYEGLFAGSTVRGLESSIAATGLAGIHIAASDPHQNILPANELASAQSPPKIPPVATPEPAQPAPTTPELHLAQDQIRRKREAGEYDIFLCHNSHDKPLVKQLGIRLIEAGILPWLDEWDLSPGQVWQSQIENQIGSIRAAAVCLGPEPVSGWQLNEMHSLLIDFTDRNRPIIPIILTNVPPGDPPVPSFLRGRTWVDLRKPDPNPIQQIIWGITQHRPA